MRVTQPLNDADIARKVREQILGSISPVPTNGCNRTTLRCPDARDYQKDLRSCCRAHIKQIVADTAEQLNQRGIVWWADYGTLLGAVRNPMVGLPAGIIPHDKDADFGILAAGPPGKDGGSTYRLLCLVRSKLERSGGYNVLIRPGGRSMKVRLSGRNHTNADFFVWHTRPDGTMYRLKYIGADKYKGRDFHRDAALPLTTVEWEGLTLPAPKNPEAFCEFRYGPDWRTPIRANHDGVRRGTGYFT